MKKDLVTDIRARLSVEEVVGSYLNLQRSGENYKALSPFKNEKTPSLIVTPSKEIWKDFSSGKGGDLFTFVMEHEGVDFKEALNILANKAGLNPADYRAQSPSSGPREDVRKEALAVLEQAADFYQAQFKKSVSVKQYVKNRGFSPQIAVDFRFGHAPDDWESLWRHLQDLKVPLRYAALAGLVKKRPIPAWLARKQKTNAKERWGDFFAARLMIPLSDPQGRVIGFTARLLADKEGIAKYVNSPQTLLYNKSRHVFGYFQAKDAIRKEGFALVVEGNLDVVACHQAGWQQTVAAGGTALTVEHLKIIGRLTKDVRLAFDGDAAGTAAMERSLKSAQAAQVNLSIISLPPGCDPDDLIKRNANLWKKLVQQHQPAPQWLMDKYCSDLDITTAPGKKTLTDIMLPVIECLSDEVEKDHYLKKIVGLGISRSSLEKKRQLLSGQATPAPLDAPISPPLGQHTQPTPDPLLLVQDKKSKISLLLGLLLIEPDLRNFLSAAQAKRLANILSSYPPADKIYTFLLESEESITAGQELPSRAERLVKSVDACLAIVKKAEKGLYLSAELDTKQQALKELFHYLEDLQNKIEKSR